MKHEGWLKMDLTEAILTLDKESESELENANVLNLKGKQEIYIYAQNLKEETIESFENQKTQDSSELTTKLEQERQKAITELRRKMKDYDEEVDIDKLAEHLLSLAKERVCH
mgnify:CR=1 FL=1